MRSETAARETEPMLKCQDKLARDCVMLMEGLGSGFFLRWVVLKRIAEILDELTVPDRN